MRRISVAAVLATSLLVGCGGDSGQDSAATAAPEATQTAQATATPGSGSGEATAGAIDVALSEWKVEPAEPSAEAGQITFNAENVGDMPHELEVIRTDTKAGDFPVESGVAKPDGEEVGEVADIAGGASKNLDVELEPAHYALICNLPGHYEAGMYADFEVK